MRAFFSVVLATMLAASAASVLGADSDSLDETKSLLSLLSEKHSYRQQFFPYEKLRSMGFSVPQLGEEFELGHYFTFVAPPYHFALGDMVGYENEQQQAAFGIVASGDGIKSRLIVSTPDGKMPLHYHDVKAVFRPRFKAQ